MALCVTTTASGTKSGQQRRVCLVVAAGGFAEGYRSILHKHLKQGRAKGAAAFRPVVAQPLRPVVRKTRHQRLRARFAANGQAVQPPPGSHAACKPCSRSSGHGKRRACLVAVAVRRLVASVAASGKKCAPRGAQSKCAPGGAQAASRCAEGNTSKKRKSLKCASRGKKQWGRGKCTSCI